MKKPPAKKTPSKNSMRVRKWRNKHKDMGGKLVQVPLKQEDYELLRTLQDSSKKKLSELICEALHRLHKDSRDGSEEKSDASISEKAVEATKVTTGEETELARITREARWKI